LNHIELLVTLISYIAC